MQLELGANLCKSTQRPPLSTPPSRLSNENGLTPNAGVPTRGKYTIADARPNQQGACTPCAVVTGARSAAASSYVQAIRKEPVPVCRQGHVVRSHSGRVGHQERLCSHTLSSSISPGLGQAGLSHLRNQVTVPHASSSSSWGKGPPTSPRSSATGAKPVVDVSLGIETEFILEGRDDNTRREKVFEFICVMAALHNETVNRQCPRMEAHVQYEGKVFQRPKSDFTTWVVEEEPSLIEYADNPGRCKCFV